MSDTEELASLLATAAPASRLELDPGRRYEVDWSRLVIPESASGVAIDGRGATIIGNPGAAPSANLITVRARGLRLSNLQIGTRDQGAKAEHQHLVFVQADGFRANALGLIGVGAGGDCMYLYTASDAAVTDLTVAAGGRNGLTIGAQSDGVAIIGCTFAGSRVQQVDMEPGGVARNVLIGRCAIDGSASSQAAVSLGGAHPDRKAQALRLIDSTIIGGVIVLWADDVTIEGCNVSATAQARAAIDMYRSVTGVSVLRCALRADAHHVVSVVGTGVGQSPDRVSIEASTMLCGHAGRSGVSASGVLSLRLTDSHLTGAGQSFAGASGVVARAVNLDEEIRLVEIERTRIESFGDLAVKMSGRSMRDATGAVQVARIAEARIAGLSAGNAVGHASQMRGLDLDAERTGALRRLVSWDDNTYDAGVVPEPRLPGGCNVVVV